MEHHDTKQFKKTLVESPSLAPTPQPKSSIKLENKKDFNNESDNNEFSGRKKRLLCIDLDREVYIGIEQEEDNIRKFEGKIGMVRRFLGIKRDEVDTYTFISKPDLDGIMEINEKSKTVFFNEKRYFLSQIETREQWVKDHSLFPQIDLDERVRRLVENVYGLNADLFLKKEAVRFAEARKLKNFDIVFSNDRNTGKTSLINLVTKIYMPKGKESAFASLFATPPKSNGRELFHAGSIQTKSATLLFDEVGIDYPQFNFLKELQSPNGTQLEKKYSKAGITNPWMIYAYVLKNYTEEISDIYYTSDKSLLTSLFFSFNVNAIDITDLIEDQDDRDWVFDSSECVEHLRRYLLGLYNSLTDEEIKSIRQASSFVKQSHYDISKYVKKASLTTTQMCEQYISCIKKGCYSSLIELFEENLIQALRSFKKKKVAKFKLSESLNDIVFTHKSGAKDRQDLTIKIHRSICDFFGIRAYDYLDCFNGANRLSKLIER